MAGRFDIQVGLDASRLLSGLDQVAAKADTVLARINARAREANAALSAGQQPRPINVGAAKREVLTQFAGAKTLSTDDAEKRRFDTQRRDLEKRYLRALERIAREAEKVGLVVENVTGREITAARAAIGRELQKQAAIAQGATRNTQRIEAQIADQQSKRLQLEQDATRGARAAATATKRLVSATTRGVDESVRAITAASIVNRGVLAASDLLGRIYRRRIAAEEAATRIAEANIGKASIPASRAIAPTPGVAIPAVRPRNDASLESSERAARSKRVSVENQLAQVMSREVVAGKALVQSTQGQIQAAELGRRRAVEYADALRQATDIVKRQSSQVTLYRGENQYNQGGHHFTPNINYARNFAAGPGGRILKVEVPREIAEAGARLSRLNGDVGVLLPRAYVNLARSVEEASRANREQAQAARRLAEAEALATAIETFRARRSGPTLASPRRSRSEDEVARAQTALARSLNELAAANRRAAAEVTSGSTSQYRDQNDREGHVWARVIARQRALEAYVARQPPPAPGYTRLYRGEPQGRDSNYGDSRRKPGAQYFTVYPLSADEYAGAPGFKGRLKQVDVPTPIAQKARVGDGEYVLPRRWAKKAKEIEVLTLQDREITSHRALARLAEDEVLSRTRALREAEQRRLAQRQPPALAAARPQGALTTPPPLRALPAPPPLKALPSWIGTAPAGSIQAHRERWGLAPVAVAQKAREERIQVLHLFPQDVMRRLNKPTAEHRWPRGFTPERKREVEEFFSGTGRTPEGKRVPRNVIITGPVLEPDEDIPGVVRFNPLGGQQGRARIIEAIARSNIDLRALRRGGRRGRGSRRDLIITTGGYEPNEGGSYTSPAETRRGRHYIAINAEPGVPRSKRERQAAEEYAEYALLHELGHADSYIHGSESSKRMWDPKRGWREYWLGKEEAAADAFARRNLVRRRIRAKRIRKNRLDDPLLKAGYEGGVTGEWDQGPYGELSGSFMRGYEEDRVAPPGQQDYYDEYARRYWAHGGYKQLQFPKPGRSRVRRQLERRRKQLLLGRSPQPSKFFAYADTYPGLTYPYQTPFDDEYEWERREAAKELREEDEYFDRPREYFDRPQKAKRAVLASPSRPRDFDPNQPRKPYRRPFGSYGVFGEAISDPRFRPLRLRPALIIDGIEDKLSDQAYRNVRRSKRPMHSQQYQETEDAVFELDKAIYLFEEKRSERELLARASEAAQGPRALLAGPQRRALPAGRLQRRALLTGPRPLAIADRSRFAGPAGLALRGSVALERYGSQFAVPSFPSFKTRERNLFRPLAFESDEPYLLYPQLHRSSQFLFDYPGDPAARYRPREIPSGRWDKTRQVQARRAAAQRARDARAQAAQRAREQADFAVYGIPDPRNPDQMAQAAKDDPYWLNVIEQGVRVADGFETEDYDAVIWRAQVARANAIEKALKTNALGFFAGPQRKALRAGPQRRALLTGPRPLALGPGESKYERRLDAISRVELIPIEEALRYAGVRPDPRRTEFDQPVRLSRYDELDPKYFDLLESISRHGIQKPLEVDVAPALRRDRDDRDLPQLAEGYHRLAAARDLGLTHVPVKFYKELGGLGSSYVSDLSDRDRARLQEMRRQLGAGQPPTSFAFPREQPLYHGTRTALVGSVVPPAVHGQGLVQAPNTAKEYELAKNLVSATSSLEQAWHYAVAARGEGSPRVYRVVPTGPVRPDIAAGAEAGTGAVQSTSPFRIVGEVSASEIRRQLAGGGGAGKPPARPPTDFAFPSDDGRREARKLAPVVAEINRELIESIRRLHQGVRKQLTVCYQVSRDIEKAFGLPLVKGVFSGALGGDVRRAAIAAGSRGDVFSQHAWNRLPGGGILDATADQFGFEGIRQLGPGDPQAASYREFTRREQRRIARFQERNYGKFPDDFELGFLLAPPRPLTRTRRHEIQRRRRLGTGAGFDQGFDEFDDFYFPREDRSQVGKVIQVVPAYNRIYRQLTAEEELQRQILAELARKIRAIKQSRILYEQEVLRTRRNMIIAAAGVELPPVRRDSLPAGPRRLELPPIRQRALLAGEVPGLERAQQVAAAQEFRYKQLSLFNQQELQLMRAKPDRSRVGHRGYSPERMDRVREVFEDLIEILPARLRMGVARDDEEMFSPFVNFDYSRLGVAGTRIRKAGVSSADHANVAKRRILEAIARSSIDVEEYARFLKPGPVTVQRPIHPPPGSIAAKRDQLTYEPVTYVPEPAEARILASRHDEQFAGRYRRGDWEDEKGRRRVHQVELAGMARLDEIKTVADVRRAIDKAEMTILHELIHLIRGLRGTIGLHRGAEEGIADQGAVVAYGVLPARRRQGIEDPRLRLGYDRSLPLALGTERLQERYGPEFTQEYYGRRSIYRPDRFNVQGELLPPVRSQALLAGLPQPLALPPGQQASLEYFFPRRRRVGRDAESYAATFLARQKAADDSFLARQLDIRRRHLNTIPVQRLSNRDLVDAANFYTESTGRAEKVSRYTQWKPEERAAYDKGDIREFSRLRGYSGAEIRDFLRYLKLIAELGRRGLADTQIHPYETLPSGYSRTLDYNSRAIAEGLLPDELGHRPAAGDVVGQGLDRAIRQKASEILEPTFRRLREILREEYLFPRELLAGAKPPPVLPYRPQLQLSAAPRAERIQQLRLFSQQEMRRLNKPTDEHRWPRGYTPERMREVRELFDSMLAVADAYMVEGQAFSPFVNSEYEGFPVVRRAGFAVGNQRGPRRQIRPATLALSAEAQANLPPEILAVLLGGAGVGRGSQLGQRRILETIARSKVDIGELTSLLTGKSAGLEIFAHDDITDYYGQYLRPGRPKPGRPFSEPLDAIELAGAIPTGALTTRKLVQEASDAMERVFLHEIEHLIARLKGTLPVSTDFSEDQFDQFYKLRGAEEAKADDFADSVWVGLPSRHRRGRGRKPLEIIPGYDVGTERLAAKHGAPFAEGYYGERRLSLPPPPPPPPFNYQPELPLWYAEGPLSRLPVRGPHQPLYSAWPRALGAGPQPRALEAGPQGTSFAFPRDQWPIVPSRQAKAKAEKESADSAAKEAKVRKDEVAVVEATAETTKKERKKKAKADTDAAGAGGGKPPKPPKAAPPGEPPDEPPTPKRKKAAEDAARKAEEARKTKAKEAAERAEEVRKAKEERELKEARKLDPEYQRERGKKLEEAAKARQEGRYLYDLGDEGVRIAEEARRQGVNPLEINEILRDQVKRRQKEAAKKSEYFDVVYRRMERAEDPEFYDAREDRRRRQNAAVQAEARRESIKQHAAHLDTYTPEEVLDASTQRVREARLGLLNSLLDENQVTQADIANKAQYGALQARHRTEEEAIFSEKQAADRRYISAVNRRAAAQAQLKGNIAEARTPDQLLTQTSSAQKVKLSQLREQVVTNGRVLNMTERELRELTASVHQTSDIAKIKGLIRVQEQQIKVATDRAARAAAQQVSRESLGQEIPRGGGFLRRLNTVIQMRAGRYGPLDGDDYSTGAGRLFGSGFGGGGFGGGFGGGGEGIGGPLGFFGQGALTTLKYAVPGALLYGSLRTVRELITNAQDLELIMGQLQDQFEKTGKGDQFDGARKAILDIAAETGQSAIAITKLYQRFQGVFGQGELGISPDITQRRVTEEVRAGSKLALVTGIPEETLKDSIAAIGANFGNLDERFGRTGRTGALAIGQITESIGNLAISVENQFGVAASEVISFLGDLAPVASEAGFSMEEFAAVSGIALQTSGKNAASIAEAFGRVLPRLQQNLGAILRIPALSQGAFKIQQEDLKEAFGGGNSANNLPDISKIFFKIRASYRTASATDRAAIQEALGGTRETQALVGLLNAPEAKVRQAVEKLQPEAVGGLLDERASRRAASLSTQIAILGQSFQKLGDALFRLGLGDFLKTLIRLTFPIKLLIDGLSLLANVNDSLGGMPATLLAIAAAAKVVAFAASKGFGLGALRQIGQDVRSLKGDYDQRVRGVTPAVPGLALGTRVDTPRDAISAEAARQRAGAVVRGGFIVDPGGVRTRQAVGGFIGRAIIPDAALRLDNEAVQASRFARTRAVGAGIAGFAGGALGAVTQINPLIIAGVAGGFALQAIKAQEDRARASLKTGVGLADQLAAANIGKGFGGITSTKYALSHPIRSRLFVRALPGVRPIASEEDQERIRSLETEELERFLRQAEREGSLGRGTARSELRKRALITKAQENTSIQINALKDTMDPEKFEELQQQLLEGDQDAEDKANKYIEDARKARKGSKRRKAYEKGVADLKALNTGIAAQNRVLTGEEAASLFALSEISLQEYNRILEKDVSIIQQQIDAGDNSKKTRLDLAKAKQIQSQALVQQAQQFLQVSQSADELFGTKSAERTIERILDQARKPRITTEDRAAFGREALALQKSERLRENALIVDAELRLAHLLEGEALNEEARRFAAQGRDGKAFGLRGIPGFVEGIKSFGLGVLGLPSGRKGISGFKGLFEGVKGLFGGGIGQIVGEIKPTPEELFPVKQAAFQRTQQRLDAESRLRGLKAHEGAVDAASRSLVDAERRARDLRTHNLSLEEKFRDTGAIEQADIAIEENRERLYQAQIARRNREARYQAVYRQQRIGSRGGSGVDAALIVERDAVAQAKINLAEAQKNKRSNEEIEDLRFALFEAQRAEREAARAYYESEDALFNATHAKDRLSILNKAVDTANRNLALAKQNGNIGGINNAAAALAAAQHEMNDYIQDGITAAENFLISDLIGRGLVVEAAQKRLEQAERQRNLAATRNDPNVLKVADQQVQDLRFALRDTVLDDTISDLAFKDEMDQISIGQHIAELQLLLTRDDLTKQRRQEIQRKIKALKDESGADLQFNTPSDIQLPTLYEVRRLSRAEQRGGGYQDNRIITVNMVNNNATDYQGSIDRFADLVDRSNGVYGTQERPY